MWINEKDSEDSNKYKKKRVFKNGLYKWLKKQVPGLYCLAKRKLKSRHKIVMKHVKHFKT